MTRPSRDDTIPTPGTRRPRQPLRAALTASGCVVAIAAWGSSGHKSSTSGRGGARSPAYKGWPRAATPWGGPAISTRTRGIALDQSGAG